MSSSALAAAITLWKSFSAMSSRLSLVGLGGLRGSIQAFPKELVVHPPSSVLSSRK